MCCLYITLCHLPPPKKLPLPMGGSVLHLIRHFVAYEIPLKRHLDRVCPFSKIVTTNGQTDRQTDRQNEHWTWPLPTGQFHYVANAATWPSNDCHTVMVSTLFGIKEMLHEWQYEPLSGHNSRCIISNMTQKLHRNKCQWFSNRFGCSARRMPCLQEYFCLREIMVIFRLVWGFGPKRLPFLDLNA